MYDLDRYHHLLFLHVIEYNESMTVMTTALRKRYASPEHACFFEVRSASGFDSKRSADAIYMNLWPSRGLEIGGVEIKASRSDWLRELADPSKSAPIQRFCDRWWLAIEKPEIIRDGELPSTWGLLVLQGTKLVQRVEAPKLTPEPITRTFMGALFRSATAGIVPQQHVDSIIADRLEEQAKRDASHDTLVRKQLEARVLDLETRIRDFEHASGISLHYQNMKTIGNAVSLVMANGCTDKLVDTYRRARMPLAGALNAMDAAIKELEAPAPVHASTLPRVIPFRKVNR